MRCLLIWGHRSLWEYDYRHPLSEHHPRVYKKKGTLWRQFLVSTNEVKRLTVSFNLLLSWPFSVHCLNGSFMSSRTLPCSLLHRHQHQLTGGPQCRADPSGFWCARRRASLTVPRRQITPDPRLSCLGEEGHGQISTQLLRKCWQDTGQKQSRLHLRHFAEERTGGRLWAGPDVDFSGRRSQRMSLRTIV